jgi:hypothetical protein
MGNPAGVAGAQPMRGSARGLPSLKTFLIPANAARGPIMTGDEAAFEKEAHNP